MKIKTGMGEVAVILWIAASVVVPTGAAAQAKSEPSLAPVAAAPATAGPNEAIFKNDVGTWDMKLELRGDPGEQAIEAKGTAHNRLGGDGLWLESNTESFIAGIPFRGHGIYGYDRVKKKYVGVWLDSTDFYPAIAEGSYDPEKKVLSLSGEMRAPDGSMVTIRRVTDWKDPEHPVFRMFVKTQGGKELESLTITYSRRK